MATLDTNNKLLVQLQSNDSEYVKLVSHIATLWDNAKTKAIIAVNSELLDANLPNREELQAQLNLLLDTHQE